MGGDSFPDDACDYRLRGKVEIFQNEDSVEHIEECKYSIGGENGVPADVVIITSE